LRFGSDVDADEALVGGGSLERESFGEREGELNGWFAGFQLDGSRSSGSGDRHLRYVRDILVLSPCCRRENRASVDLRGAPVAIGIAISQQGFERREGLTGSGRHRGPRKEAHRLVVVPRHPGFGIFLSGVLVAENGRRIAICVAGIRREREKCPSAR